MARLIDAEKVYEFGHRTPFHIGIADLCDLLELLADVPTVDAVPVVRCRDCSHCDPESYHCDHPMGTTAPLRRKPDDFCSYGERKEGADNGS